MEILDIFSELLRSFSAAYHSKVLTVPTIWVSKILGMHSETDLIGLCSYYGVKVDASAKSIKFDRDTFDVTKATVRKRSFHESFGRLVIFIMSVSITWVVFHWFFIHQMLPRHERFVENKIKIRIEDILLLKSSSRN